VASVIAVLVTLLVTWVLVASLRPAAIAVGLTDAPVGRKRHAGEVPIVGGIAMYAGIFLGICIAMGTSGNSVYLLAAGALLIMVGVLDDWRGLPCIPRLLAEITAALIMIIGGGLVITDIGNPFGFGIIQTGPVGILVSVLITVSVINAFNFIDGIDGLAGSMALVALLAGATASGWASPTVSIATVACAAIIGFLFFNLPMQGNRHTRTFMGDAGSTLLGLVVVWHTISITQGDSRAISPVTGLWFALVPLADFFTCFVRRIASGCSPFDCGRDHIHHALLRSGFTAQQTLIILTGLAATYAGIGLFGVVAGAPDFLMFALWVILGASQYWLVSRLGARPKSQTEKAVSHTAAHASAGH
jgi:UDP-GlcNAc:undecaprenyl-phosphate GlcNAc-1-phosphate transferase